jgi:hypothetical protein
MDGRPRFIKTVRCAFATLFGKLLRDASYWAEAKAKGLTGQATTAANHVSAGKEWVKELRPGQV